MKRAGYMLGALAGIVTLVHVTRPTGSVFEAVASNQSAMLDAMFGPRPCGAYIWPGTVNAQFMCQVTGLHQFGFDRYGVKHDYHIDYFGTVWTDADAEWLRAMYYVGA